ncbi:MAG: hypothetical protein LWW98_10655 [Deltaproteobacteria bacterium]|nr:hypothetical protein [Deltaproteobacteria bacterium]
MVDSSLTLLNPPKKRKVSRFKLVAISHNQQILCRSIEADIMVPESEEKVELIEATIGELSSFHDTYGYYAQGVDYTTSKLPEGWVALRKYATEIQTVYPVYALKFMMLSSPNCMRGKKRVFHNEYAETL